MQLKNIKTSSQAQQLATTEEVGFLLTPSGLCALQVCEGIPIVEVMQRYEESLNALCVLLRRIGRDVDHPMNDSEAEAIALLTEVVAAMHGSCVRGLDATGGAA
ncbi:hypothetical protein [Pseudomonas aeruginosa]|uniref:hypothetical protein n=1 Tax=Pseudomonas aeruginosa TaxID=287 RepID=UPI0003B9DA4A|nr:hypothetical protein [Pseudomonas aeruginosa]ERV52491.1 hypothetical protein Q063_04858 [Pseudomonas aeruginosa BL09]